MSFDWFNHSTKDTSAAAGSGHYGYLLFQIQPQACWRVNFNVAWIVGLDYTILISSQVVEEEDEDRKSTAEDNIYTVEGAEK